MTNAELAILCLIGEQPRHGYKIEAVIEARGMREWTEIGFSSIYYLLKKLERKDLVEGELEGAERGPSRKVYRLTPTGLEALQAGLLAALSIPSRRYPALLLGLNNLPDISGEQALRALRRYRQELIARLEQVGKTWEVQRPLPYFVDAIYDFNITMIKGELTWIEGFIETMEAEFVRKHEIDPTPAHSVRDDLQGQRFRGSL